MFYSYNKSCPAAGTSDSPETLDLDLSSGTIHQVDFIFPSDSERNLHAQVWQGGHQLWPSNPGDSIMGDNMVISFREFFPITVSGNNLTLRAWNTHATDALIMYINIGILPEDILQPFSLSRLIEALGK